MIWLKYALLPLGLIFGSIMTANATVFDQDNDDKSDLLWRNSQTGDNWFYLMDDVPHFKAVRLNTVSSDWVAYRGDFNGDGIADILWRNSQTGVNWQYQMNGTSIASSKALNTVGLDWTIVGIGDFNGDYRDDILWRHSATGLVWLYQMNGLQIQSNNRVSTVSGTDWQIAGIGDFNGDSTDDVLWRNQSTGANYIYLMANGQIAENFLLNFTGADWVLAAVANIDADSDVDLIWRNTITGLNWSYIMENGKILFSQQINRISDMSWAIVGAGHFDDVSGEDLLWRNAVTGQNVIYSMVAGYPVAAIALNTLDNVWELVGKERPIVISDNDYDGIPDGIDEDDDNDGVPDTIDAFPLNPKEAFDYDGDGLGNNVDNDDDGDGVEDILDLSVDLRPFIFNPDELVYDTSRMRLHALDTESATLISRDITRGTEIVTALTGIPIDMGLSLDQKRLFIVVKSQESFSGSVITIDANSLAIISSFPLTFEPTEIEAVDINRVAVAGISSSFIAQLNLFNVFSGDLLASENAFSGEPQLLFNQASKSLYLSESSLTASELRLFGLSDEGLTSQPLNLGAFSSYGRVWGTPNGKYIIGASGNVYEVNHLTNELIGVNKLANFIRDIDFEERSGLMYLLEQDKRLHIYSASTLQSLYSLSLGNFDAVKVLSSDYSFLVLDWPNMSNIRLYEHPCLACLNNSAPKAALTNDPGTLMDGDKFTLSVSKSFDKEDDEHELKVRWDFNSDGIYDTSFSSSLTYDYLFGFPGVYHVTAQVMDSQGMADSITEIYTISDNPDFEPVDIIGDISVTIPEYSQWKVEQFEQHNHLVLAPVYSDDDLAITFVVEMQNEGVFILDYSKVYFADTRADFFIVKDGVSFPFELPLDADQYVLELTEGRHEISIEINMTNNVYGGESLFSIDALYAGPRPAYDELGTYVLASNSDDEIVEISAIKGLVNSRVNYNGWSMNFQPYTGTFDSRKQLGFEYHIAEMGVGRYSFDSSAVNSMFVSLSGCQEIISLTMDIFEFDAEIDRLASSIEAECSDYSSIKPFKYVVRINSDLPHDWLDFDFDGESDASDHDDDNDGFDDPLDAFPYDPNEWLDSDGDGYGDNGDLFPDNSTEWADNDLDGIGDNADPDDDNDLIPDTEDCLPFNPVAVFCLESGVDMGVDMFVKGIGQGSGMANPLSLVNGVYLAEIQVFDGFEAFIITDANLAAATCCGVYPEFAGLLWGTGKIHDMLCASGISVKNINMGFTSGTYLFQMSYAGSDGETGSGAFYVEKIAD